MGRGSGIDSEEVERFGLDSDLSAEVARADDARLLTITGQVDEIRPHRPASEQGDWITPLIDELIRQRDRLRGVDASESCLAACKRLALWCFDPHRLDARLLDLPARNYSTNRFYVFGVELDQTPCCIHELSGTTHFRDDEEAEKTICGMEIKQMRTSSLFWPKSQMFSRCCRSCLAVREHSFADHPVFGERPAQRADMISCEQADELISAAADGLVDVLREYPFETVELDPIFQLTATVTDVAAPFVGRFAAERLLALPAEERYDRIFGVRDDRPGSYLRSAYYPQVHFGVGEAVSKVYGDPADLDWNTEALTKAFSHTVFSAADPNDPNHKALARASILHYAFPDAIAPFLEGFGTRNKDGGELARKQWENNLTLIEKFGD